MRRMSNAVRMQYAIARADWDNFETSWDFRDQPLLRPGLKGATLEASWRNWEAQSTAAIRRMQELETENNRLFIAAYGLDGELQPEVPEEQITLARAEARRDMAAFLSYAVGCMMGRYSLDHPGLILANAGDTLREFLEKVGKPLDQLTFAPDEDGIIPVLDGEWFEDDIVARTRDFLRATFGEATLRGKPALHRRIARQGPAEVFPHRLLQGPPPDLQEAPHLLAVLQPQKELPGPHLPAPLHPGHVNLVLNVTCASSSTSWKPA